MRTSTRDAAHLQSQTVGRIYNEEKKRQKPSLTKARVILRVRIMLQPGLQSEQVTGSTICIRAASYDSPVT